MQTEVYKSDFTQRFTDVASTKRKTIYVALSVKVDGLHISILGKFIKRTSDKDIVI